MPFSHVFARVLGLESVVAGIVFVLILAVMTFALVRYRAAASGEASQNTEHPRLEAAYALVLLAIAISIVVVTRSANAEDHPQPAATPVRIVVTGFQWCWRFHYVSPPVTVSGNCINGDTPTLVVPAGVPLKIETTSSDVIHSFWVPDFRFKMDAFPNHVNSFVMTVPHPGDWEGHCAEFCGERHAFMTFQLKAVTPAAFTRWISTQPTPAAA